MPLDFHVAISERVVGQADDRVLSIDFQTHQAFFRTELARPLIVYFEDFYSDRKFAGRQIEALLADVTTVLQKVNVSSPHHRWLEDLRRACEDALEKKMMIFVFCD